MGQWAAQAWLEFPSPGLAIMFACPLAMLLAALAGRVHIQLCGRRLGERITSDSATLTRLHQSKAHTPTMGGWFIALSILAVLVIFGSLEDPFLRVSIMVLVALAAVGAVDDVAKLRGRQGGMSVRTKLTAQILVATVAGIMVWSARRDLPGPASELVPGLGSAAGALVFIAWTALWIVGFSNAVNLADGLDGLAAGCLLPAFAALGLVAWADDSMPAGGSSSHQMALVAMAACGAVAGFLWHNRHPARVFMGDIGSLALGGLVGLLGVVLRVELLLTVIAGVFVVEAASVIMQVAHFRATGSRLFRCAPLHHHFEFAGWRETQIVRRFWLVSVLCAVIGVSLAFGLSWRAQAVALRDQASPSSHERR